MTKPPCYECDVHTSTCHGVCKAYKIWRAKKDRENALKRKEAKIGVAISEIHQARIKSKNRNMEKKMRGGDR